MANQTYNVVDGTDNATRRAIRLVDNGDGTFSIAMSAGGSGGSVIVSQTAAQVSTPTTLQNAATANGNGTVLDVQGMATAILDIVSSPAMSGGTTVNFEISPDDSVWYTISADQIGSSSPPASSVTADGAFRFNVAGFKSLRARISAYSAGTVTVKGRATAVVGVTRNLYNTELLAPTAERNTVTTPNSLAGTIAVTRIPVSSADFSSVRGDNTYLTTRVTAKSEKGTAGVVNSLQVFNFGAALAYFQLHNKATIPLATEAPLAGCVWAVPAGTATVPGALFLNIDDLGGGVWMSTGIGWALSSAINVFTDSLTNTNFLLNLGRL